MLTPPPTPGPLAAPEPGPPRRRGATSISASIRARTPGVLLALAAAGASLIVTMLVTGVSALLVAIVLGIVTRNLVRLPAVLEPGLGLAAKSLLRVGIVLLGLQLGLGDILALGPGMIAVVVAIVGSGLGATLLIGRALGVSATQRLLIACGFSICGAAAVAAADGVIETEDEEEVVTAVALVVLFGTLMIPVLPVAGTALGLGDAATGKWVGGSLHEVAHVVAAGSALGSSGLAAAVVVKLARVLLLAPVLTVISLRRRRTMRTTAAVGTRPPVVPLFVTGFLAMVLVRTSGLVPDGVLETTAHLQTVLLASAMFALGTGVRVSMFRRVGFGPVVLAAASTLVVTGVALVGVVTAA